MREKRGVKGRKAALRKLMERRQRKEPPRVRDERRYLSADAVFRAKHAEALEDHMAELRSYGLDPNLIGEHEVDPVMCPCCGEPIPWSIILAHRS